MTQQDDSKPYSQTAQALIDKSIAHARAWTRIESFGFKENKAMPVHLYIHDLPTGFTWMAKVDYTGFMRGATAARNDGEGTLDTAAAGLGSMIEEIAVMRRNEKTPGDQILTRNTITGDIDRGNPDLFHLASLHAGSSSMIFDDELLRPDGHFLIIRYVTKEGIKLRSMVLPPDITENGAVIEKDKLEEAIRAIVEFDQGNPAVFGD